MGFAQKKNAVHYRKKRLPKPDGFGSIKNGCGGLYKMGIDVVKGYDKLPGVCWVVVL